LKKITLHASIILVVVSASMLTGCSREPSESNILDAYSHEVDQTNRITRKFSGNAMEIKVNAVKKINCAESTIKGQFNCDVDIDLTLPIIGQNQQKTMLTVAKGDRGEGQQGWIVLRGNLAQP
jgi:hypothetical protein